MSLNKIETEDLIFTNKCFEDRINTELQLLDYDWMTYNLKTMFPTRNQGKLKKTLKKFKKSLDKRSRKV